MATAVLGTHEWLQLGVWLVGVILTVGGMAMGVVRYFDRRLEATHLDLSIRLEKAAGERDLMRELLAKQNGRIAKLEERPVFTRDLCDQLHGRNADAIAVNSAGIEKIGVALESLNDRLFRELVPLLNVQRQLRDG